jgi:hypothetical protein
VVGGQCQERPEALAMAREVRVRLYASLASLDLSGIRAVRVNPILIARLQRWRNLGFLLEQCS